MEKKIKQLKGSHPALIVAIALSLAFSIISNIRVSSFHRTKAEESIIAEDISYNVYIGLTDKNQNRQIIEYDVAKEIIKTVCINHSAGYTLYDVNGGYKENNIVHTEKTIILEMDRITEDTLYSVVNDIKKRLNVHSVMIVKKPIEVFDY